MSKKNLSQLFAQLEGLDEKSGQFLMKALSANNLPGFDYIEFKQSLAALTGLQMDEATAFRSAFATASTMGLTKKKLLESTQHYKKVLQKEKGQFDMALKSRIAQRVDGRSDENKRYRNRIKQIQEQIKQLEAELVQLQRKMEENDKMQEKERQRLTVQQENFERTYQLIQQEIDRDAEKVSAYL